MREDRGKRIDNGEWVYGYYTHFRNLNIDGHTIHHINGSFYQVHPDTLGQRVNWENKHKVELWQGDIVEYNDTEGRIYIHEVKWDKREACWFFGNISIRQIVDSGYFQGMNLKVIGNIHEY